MTTHKPLRHKARHVLPEFRIQHPDHGRVAYRWMGHQDALDFNWGDIRTAVNNQLLLAGDEPEVALFILAHDGPSIKPAPIRRIGDLAPISEKLYWFRPEWRYTVGS